MLATIVDASANAVQVLALFAAGLFCLGAIANAAAKSWGGLLLTAGLTLLALSVVWLA